MSRNITSMQVSGEKVTYIDSHAWTNKQKATIQNIHSTLILIFPLFSSVSRLAATLTCTILNVPSFSVVVERYTAGG